MGEHEGEVGVGAGELAVSHEEAGEGGEEFCFGGGG